MKKITIITIIAILLTCLFAAGCGDDNGGNSNNGGGGGPSQYEGKLLILQAYGSSETAAGATHSFVELYNTTSSEIDLDGISLYYADGIRGLEITEDWEWERISLKGKIPAGGSFLILGPNQGSTSARYKIEEKHGKDYGDINDNSFILSNRSFKAAIIEGSAVLGMQNPFNTDGEGKKVDGYIDMVGAANDPEHATNPDNIFGYETAPARCSASEAVRRKNLTDTDDNSADFIAARYAKGSTGMSNEMLEVRYPRNSKAGKWDPFAEPAQPPPPPPGTEMLMILQANTYGNANNTTDGSGFPRSLVELYNNTNEAIDLTADNYYLHIGDAADWTYAIKLTGSIPARCSFLIVDNTMPEVTGGNGNMNATPRAPLPVADQSYNFIISNDGFKIALLRNQTTLSVANPFTEVGLSNDYIDMLGVGTASQNTNGYETARFANQSRPRVPRRMTLDDTNNNSVDFGDVDYRNTNPISNEVLLKVWPRNSAAGAWDPITGDAIN